MTATTDKEVPVVEAKIVELPKEIVEKYNKQFEELKAKRNKA